VARDQIRMSIGHHKAMASVWPQAGSNLHEVQAIACEVLGLPMGSNKNNNNKPIKPSFNEISSSPETPLLSEPSLQDVSCGSDALNLMAMDNLQTYWNMAAIQPDTSFSWWAGGDNNV
jgi:hypothetical protein